MDGCLREMSLPKQAELDIYSSLKITEESYLSSWEIASCSKLGHYILRALGLTWEKKKCLPLFSAFMEACGVLPFEVGLECVSLIMTRSLTRFAEAAQAGKSHQPLGDRWLRRAGQGCGLCDLSRWGLGS